MFQTSGMVAACNAAIRITFKPTPADWMVESSDSKVICFSGTGYYLFLQEHIVSSLKKPTFDLRDDNLHI